MSRTTEAVEQTTGAHLMRGGAWTALSSFVPQLYTMALSIAAARFLGPSDFGRQSFIAFIAISIHLGLTSGMGLTVMRSVAETLGGGRTDQAHALVAWALRIQAVAGLAGGASLVIVAAAGADPPAAWALAGVFVALGVVQSVANAVLLGIQRYRAAAVIGLVTGGVTLPLTVAVLAAGGGIAGIFAVEAAAAGVTLAWSAALARRVLPAAGRGALAPALRRSALRFAGWTTASALVTLVVWRRSEFVFLAHYSTDAQIAVYSIGFATVSALAAVTERFTMVLVPAFATLRGANARDRIRFGYARALRLLMFISFPLTAGSAAVGPALLRVLYGDEYRDAGAVLAILAAVLPFTAVSSAAAALLSGLDDARTPLLVGLAAAVVNIGLAFALIPPLDAPGAAVANLGAQAAGAVGLYLGARTTAGAVDWRAGSLLRCALAAAGCGLASLGMLALLGGALGVASAIAIGAAVFLGLTVALRVLPADDAAWLDGHLGQHLGGRVGVLMRSAAQGRPA